MPGRAAVGRASGRTVNCERCLPGPSARSTPDSRTHSNVHVHCIQRHVRGRNLCTVPRGRFETSSNTREQAARGPSRIASPPYTSSAAAAAALSDAGRLARRRAAVSPRRDAVSGRRRRLRSGTRREPPAGQRASRLGF